MEGDTMIHIDGRIAAKNARPETRWSRPVHRPQRTIGEKIARAAHAFEMRRTKLARKWVAVFMNEETIMIALHGSLTGAEKAQAQSPAGAAEVQEFHRQLFAGVSALLLQQIKSITGMDVRHTSAEIDSTTGSVVHLLTTETVGENFPRAPSGFARTSTPGSGLSCWHKGRVRQQSN
jgi:uncharacterized protein YbcI